MRHILTAILPVNTKHPLDNNINLIGANNATKYYSRNRMELHDRRLVEAIPLRSRSIELTDTLTDVDFTGLD